MPDPDQVSRRRFLTGSLAAAGIATLGLSGCGPPRQSPRHSLPSLDGGSNGSLREHATNAKLLFGFAVDTRSLRENESYRRTVQEQCSVVVAENAMKWHALRPSPRDFYFDDADALLTFCEQNRIKLRGHALCWHEALPAWFDATANQSNARQLLVNHIHTVAGRYSGRIHSWDVVNEAIDVRNGRPDGLRNTPWLRLAGPDYIETAFRAAREADPTALLSYNEYGIEADTHDAAEKRSALLLLLRRLKQRNVPIDAVGIQSHLHARSQYGYGAGLQQFIESCRSMDLEVFLSEMDVSDRDLPQNIDTRDAAVAAQYRTYLGTVLAARNVTAVLTWGVDDGQTWLNQGDEARRDHQPQRPLLFDSRFHPKPAFAAVREAFDERGRKDLPRAATKQQQNRAVPSRTDRSVPHLPRL